MKKIIVLNDIDSLDRKNETSNEVKNNNEPSLKSVLDSMKHLVSSKEWQEMEDEIKLLTKKEKKEISTFINEKIKPEFSELKENIFNKEKRHEIMEKIKNKIGELKDNIKDMEKKHENKTENPNYVTASVQSALLNVSSNIA